MALILNIETSTNVCSASLSDNGKIIDILENMDDRAHASTLTVFIEQLLEKNNIKCSSLDAIAVSEGPGSYTGLRIGVSTAKGICYAVNKPLIAVNTLTTMAIMAKESVPKIEQNSLLCPMIDARRMEAYTSIFDVNLNLIQKTKAEIVDEETYLPLLEKHKMYFFGNGADKFKEVIKHKNAIFIDDIYASAKHMGTIADEHFNHSNFKDVAYFEPFYLKDFVATTSKKNILNKPAK